MSTIVTRAGKGSALTHNEVDANFVNLNTDKIQSGDTVGSLIVLSATISGGSITGITDLAVADGGTGASTLTENNVILGNGASPVQFVAPGTTGNVLTSNGTTWVSSSTAGGFPSGTLMLFQQTNAPTGWTKQTTHNNKALRVVSGTAGSGGSVDFTTAFASGTTGSTTLTTTQIPSHTHLINKSTGGVVAGGAGMAAGATNTTATSQATGGGGSHDHSLSLEVLYVDVIIASKD
jgi:hypothetical protein